MDLGKRIYRKIFGRNRVKSDSAILREWQKAGKPAPPPHIVKQRAIKQIKSKFKYQLFIETGTYLGDMVEAQKKNFNKVYSIELSSDLYRDAVKRFENDKNITLLQGDSGDVLIDLMPTIKQPAIFWLDGHYSAGYTAKGKKNCPIYEELTAIFNAGAMHHVLLIDDARLFIGKDDYPTISELTAFTKKHFPLADIYCDNDIIHILT